LVRSEAVLSGGVVSGDDEEVGLAGGETGDGGGGGVAGIDALGIDPAGGAVIDIVTDDRGVGLSGPGEGNTLSGLSEGERAQQQRSDTEKESGGTPEEGGMGEKERFRSRRK
jgi:hypothetical protein